MFKEINCHKFCPKEVMEDYTGKFLIIGADPVGLSTAKSFKDAEIAYDRIDADSDVGGNWKHGIYRTANIISSKKTTEYADFPMPEDYPDSPSREQLLNYLKSYAEDFNLRENIEFKTKVVKVLPREDEFWDVELEIGEKRIYKGVVVCNGHHWQKRFPDYEGKFTGEYFHLKDYKSPEQSETKEFWLSAAEIRRALSPWSVGHARVTDAGANR